MTLDFQNGTKQTCLEFFLRKVLWIDVECIAIIGNIVSSHVRISIYSANKKWFEVCLLSKWVNPNWWIPVLFTFRTVYWMYDVFWCVFEFLFFWNMHRKVLDLFFSSHMSSYAMTFSGAHRVTFVASQERCEFTSRISRTTVPLRHFHLQFLGNLAPNAA